MNTTRMELKLRDFVVPPQGGYTAKQLPCRVHNDHVLSTDLAEPELESDLRRMQAGVEFEDSIGTRITAAQNAVEVSLESNFSKIRAALIPKCDRTKASKALREQLTMLCMQNGVQFIWNARFPADLEQSRVSEPDFLVRIGGKESATNGWAYAPGDVKHHKSLEGASAEQEWMVSSITTPAFEKAVNTSFGSGKPQYQDSIQLAHYHRHLEALGHAQTTESVWGGVIGKEGYIVWRDLAGLTYSHSVLKKSNVLEIYDLEFEHRLNVIRQARAIAADADLEPLVTFEWRAECKSCPWRSVCKDDLVAADHITLLRGITPSRAQAHYQAGVTTRAQIAKLDNRTAQLIDDKVDVMYLMKAARDTVPETLVSELLVMKMKPEARQTALESLELLGVRTAGDVLKLHPGTAAYSDFNPHKLADAIDHARVRIVGGRGEVHLRRHVKAFDLPRADIELDVDMENDPDGLIYLWGTRVSVTRKGLTLPGEQYKPFYTFDPSNEEGEAEAFRGLWKWITALQSLAENTGSTFKAYCYTKAENRCMESLARRHAGKSGIPTIEEVCNFLDSEQWVDLYEVISTQTVWPTEDMSLKTTAKWASFSWRASGASGDQSIGWYMDAIAGDTKAAKKLLDYNEDDVTATFVLRKWLSGLLAKGPDKLTNVSKLDKRFNPGGRRKTA